MCLQTHPSRSLKSNSSYNNNSDHLLLAENVLFLLMHDV
jgi:hypothetical protein